MNRMVKLWDRSKSIDPKDVITIDGDQIKIGEAVEMADRQRSDPKAMAELPKNQYRNVIRFLSEASLSNVLELKTITYINLKRLGVKRNLTKAIKFNSRRGSVQVDVGSIRNWLRLVTTKDKKAIAQLVAIDATACSRG